MMRDEEIVVVGLGAMGSAALYHLARRGVAPVGIEQHHIIHPFGSSYGNSRAYRTFYHHPLYASLAEAALPMWRELEALSGESLLTLCGWIAYAKPGNESFERNVRVMQSSTFPYEMLSPEEVAARIPALRIPEDTVACLSTRSGFLDANRCVRAQLSVAVRFGATIREHVRVEQIDLGSDRPVVVTSAGQFRCSRLIVAPGPWAPRILKDLALPLRVTRQQTFYFRPRAEAAYRPDRMPVYVDYDTLYYGFPYHGPGLKVADDKLGDPTDPETISRELDLDKRDQLMHWLESIMPGSNLTFVEGDTCMYTLTPDGDFLIGRHPLHPNVFVAAGFSGHGFKFATLVGRLLAELATEGKTSYPTDHFRLDRFDEKRADAGDRA